MANMEQTCQLIVDILNEHRKAELDNIVNEYLRGDISIKELIVKANVIANDYEYRIEAIRSTYYHPRVSLKTEKKTR